MALSQPKKPGTSWRPPNSSRCRARRVAASTGTPEDGSPENGPSGPAP